MVKCACFQAVQSTIQLGGKMSNSTLLTLIAMVVPAHPAQPNEKNTEPPPRIKEILPTKVVERRPPETNRTGKRRSTLSKNWTTPARPQDFNLGDSHPTTWGNSGSTFCQYYHYQPDDILGTGPQTQTTNSVRGALWRRISKRRAIPQNQTGLSALWARNWTQRWR